MAKRKPSRKATAAAPEPAPDENAEQAVFAYGDVSLHDLFQQQAMQMLDRTDLSEDEKQQILVAMACPCCGSGAMSYTVKLKR